MVIRSVAAVVVAVIVLSALSSGCAGVFKTVNADDAPKTGHSTLSARTSTNTDKNNFINSKLSMPKLQSDKPEALSAVRFDGSAFHAGVLSFGCTSSSDFIVEHKIIESQCWVTLVRTKPDLCRRAPMIAELSVPWSVPESCNELDLVVTNPVLVTNESGGLSKRSK